MTEQCDNPNCPCQHGELSVYGGDMEESFIVEFYKTFDLDNDVEIIKFITKYIKQAEERGRKEIMTKIVLGTICFSCGKDKPVGLSDWCVDCMENN